MHEIREAVTLLIGNQKIFGILHLPKQAAPSPAVLMCHGFGGNKSGKFRMFVRHSQALSEAGIASFRFDFRGAGDSDGDFQDTTVEGLLQDAKQAYEWLAAHPAIDPERLGILGRSLGGMIAVHTGARFPKTKVMAIQAPVFDSKPWISQAKPAAPQFEHQGVEMNKTFIKQFAALDTEGAYKMLKQIPLLHIQSTGDQVIKPYHVEQYKKGRIGAYAPSEFIELSRSDHDFSDPAEQKILIQTTTQWFKKYI